MNLFLNGYVHVFEAEPARQLESTGDSATEIESPIAGARKSSLYGNRFRWARIALFPDRIVGFESAVDLYGLRFKRAYVEGQHKPFNLAGLCHRFQPGNRSGVAQIRLTGDCGLRTLRPQDERPSTIAD